MHDLYICCSKAQSVFSNPYEPLLLPVRLSLSGKAWEMLPYLTDTADERLILKLLSFPL